MTGTSSSDRVRRWAYWLAGVAGLFVVVVTAWLAWWSLTRPPTATAWLQPTPDNWMLPLLLVGSTAVLLWAMWMRKRGEPFRPQVGAGVGAAIAIVLGLASYWPCAEGTSLIGVVVGLLNLFTGQVESGMIGPAAAAPECRAPSLVFELARLFGLGTLVFSAFAVVAALARPAADRFHVRYARMVDVVVGLDELTLPLVRALCEERDERERRPDWYRRRLRLADWAPWAFPRSTVVVVHGNETDPLVGEARSLGALVYLGDAQDPAVLRRVVLSGWRRTALHRFYAVTNSQRVNTEIVSAVGAIIKERNQVTAIDWLSRGTVPRVIARFSDTREARDWRLRNVSAVGCLMDAVTIDGLLARTLVNRIAQFGASDLLISGDTPLTVAILDQVAQQRAFRFELQTRRQLPDEATPPNGEQVDQRASEVVETDLNRVDQLDFDTVTILANTAEELCDEWRRTRAPCAAVPSLLEPIARSADWGPAVAAAASAGGGRPVLIVTDAVSPLISARATRLSEKHPELLVFRPSANVQGVEPLRGADGNATAGEVVVRFGPTLVFDQRAPDDTWTVLARQQHECFAGRRTSQSEPVSRQEWGPDPGGLPDFFREDNLRQHRHLLMLIEQQGYEWRGAHLGDPVRPLPRTVVAAAAEREHERWCTFRYQNGWRRPAPQEAGASKTCLDEHRQNASLTSWGHYDPAQESPLQTLNIDESCYPILERLRLWGVEPWPRGTSATEK